MFYRLADYHYSYSLTIIPFVHTNNMLRLRTHTHLSPGRDFVDMITSAVELMFSKEYLDSLEDDIQPCHPDALEMRALNAKEKKYLASFGYTPRRWKRALEILYRNRKFVEAGIEGVNLDTTGPAVLHQVATGFSHYVSWARLKHLQSMDIPTLVCHGAKDILVHPRNGKMLARELNAELLWFEEGGHAANDQFCDETHAAIEKNINKAVKSSISKRQRFKRLANPPGKHPIITSWVWSVFMYLLYRAKMLKKTNTLMVYVLGLYVIVKRLSGAFRLF